MTAIRNASGAHLTHLGSDWNAFYAEKRSSATRQRDRNKRKRLSRFGETRFVNPGTAAEISDTLDALMDRIVSFPGIVDVLVKGGDYGLNEIHGREEVEAAGGKVVALPFVAGASTSGIIQKMKGFPVTD